MRGAAAFAAGLLFSIGLVLGGMTLPENVVGFLDFFGDWKPALGLVMAGAVGVFAAFYPLVVKRRAPLFAPAFDVSVPEKVDSRLIIGASVFGAGWGLGGFCPGPALVALGAGALEAAVFAASMAVGMIIYHRAFRSETSGGDDLNACG